MPITTNTMNSIEVSNYLRVPLVAIGQIVFDRRLDMVEFDQFRRIDVERLAKEDSAYVASLR